LNFPASFYTFSALFDPRIIEPGSGSRREGDSTVAQVKIRRGETIDKAMRRLKKIMDKEGIMKEIRANRYFEKPSEQRRRKAARARARAAYNT
jgi:small subunit ribosomal protein S21